MRKILCLCILLFTARGLFAQDMTGDWQGTLKAGKDLRLILHLSKSDAGGWNATLSSIDQSPDWGASTAASSVSLSGSDLKVTFEALRAVYEGKLSSDGNSISGTFAQLGRLPLEFRRPTRESEWRDPSPHTAQFVKVEEKISLEVLDWGGAGRPLVFIPGLGNTAHVFDAFAPKFTGSNHVYGITRRGFGSSSAPASGYSADRLGDDVLAVLDTLKLDRPILAGHSLGGEELSSIASRRPERIAGAIYLDAGYFYAFYDEAKGDFRIDSIEVQQKFDQLRLQPGNAKLIDELLEKALPQLEKGLHQMKKDFEGMPSQPTPPIPPIQAAIMAGVKKYTKIAVPALAIYAVPHDLGPLVPQAQRAAAEASDSATTEAQAKAFENGVPSARVVRLPHANHFVFQSNEADVLREMNAFIGGLR